MSNYKLGKKHQFGFTLLEVMVVIAILGLIAAMIVPNVMGQSEQAKVKLAKTNMAGIANALDLYKLDNHSYPTTAQGLEALVKQPTDTPNWNPAGYLKSVPVDPWGNAYTYISPGLNGDSYDLYSLGADGAEGGSGFDADISYNSKTSENGH
jgi:general secretion pathway protein G